MKIILISVILLISTYWSYKLFVGTYLSHMEVMQALGLIFEIQAKNLNASEKAIGQFKLPCIVRDFQKIVHPDAILEDFYIYRQQAFGDSLRTYIRKNYFDSQPFHETQTSQALQKHEDKSFSAYTTQLIHQMSYNIERHVTEHCLLDKLLNLPFPGEIYNKVSVANYMNKRLAKLKNRNSSAECLRDAQFQKKTYRLNIPEECIEFFNRANVEYESNDTKEIYNYVKKTNEHDQKGTELAFKAVMRIQQEMYDYGNNCTQPPRDIIMQEYINNPVLFKGRKFDIRLHIVVESTHPLIVYFYKRFYLMKCSYVFEHTEFKNQSHICSAGYQRKMHSMYSQNNITTEKEHLMDIKEITEEVTYMEFAEYLIAEGKIKDRSWIDTYMIPEMEKRFSHYFQSYIDSEGSLPDPRFGGYAACEFDVDDNLNFWLLECTPMPNLVPSPGQFTMKNFQMRLHSKAIPLIISYQRQRYRKIKSFVMEVAAQIKKLGFSALKKKLGSSSQVSQALEEQVITDPNFEEDFHRIDFVRGLNPCINAEQQTKV